MEVALWSIIRAACGTCYLHSLQTESAVGTAAMEGAAIYPESVPVRLREGMLWTLTGRDVYRLDESGQLADVDDRPGPERPDCLAPAHPWMLAMHPDRHRWRALLAEYKLIPPSWQWWSRPRQAEIEAARRKPVSQRWDGWAVAEDGIKTWPSWEPVPLLYSSRPGGIRVTHTTTSRYVTNAVLERFLGHTDPVTILPSAAWDTLADAQDQAALYRALWDGGMWVEVPRDE
jgi:hypothetical protein